MAPEWSDRLTDSLPGRGSFAGMARYPRFRGLRLGRFPARSYGPRRSWHGAHRERAIYRAAARRTASGTITAPYVVMLILMAAIVAMLGHDWWEHRPAPSIPAGAPPAVHFTICGPGARVNCVVDGDTFWMGGRKIRILDIDAPETHPPRCAREARLGEAATDRLHALLNAGEVRIAREGEDRYGRTLARVSADGRPVGDVLIAEGLARPYAGGRRPWC
jgi:endonuclease YncB( thermonuclease family)